MKPLNLTSLKRKRDGFALVITLSLMILLTLLAVGLLTLSTITLRASSQGSAVAIARSNARMAMIIALGQLQKQAGQDQRVTAPADIAGDAGGIRLATGKAPMNTKSINGIANGLTTLLPGTRYWTAVWDSVTASAPATQIYTKTPSPTNVRWLISGNETGRSAAEAYTPAATITEVSGSGNVADADKAVVLVGVNTVGSPSAETLDDYVAAPLVEINTGSDQSPGLRGRYAWWVGDEGVKARINVSQTLTDPARYSSLAAQRRAWETVDGCKEYPLPSDPMQLALPKLVTLPESDFVFGKAAGNGATARQGVFHSATSDSQAVIADTLNGGTRIDLTAILAAGLGTANPVPSVLNYPMVGKNIVPTIGAPSIKAPRWDVVRDFHERAKNLQSGALLVKASTSEYTPAIAPVVTDFRILMGVHFVPASGTSASGMYKANPCGKIAVAIANPYAAALKWDKDLEFEVMNMTPMGNKPARIWNLGANSVFIGAPTSDEARHLSSESSVFNSVLFRIRPSSLAPGEARAYTHVGSAMRPAGAGNPTLVVDLGPFGGSGSDFKSSIERDTNGTWSSTAFPALDVRESWQTTLIKLEMRLSGGSSSSLLRRIERFELDNGYFSPNTLRPTEEQILRWTGPVPLMCYAFQISQPGVDYTAENLMPAGYEMGQRGSTLRTFMDFNLQGTRILKPITSYNPPPYFMQSNNALSQLDPGPAGGNTGSFFTKNLLANPMPWGRAPDGAKKTVLFSVPAELASLAQLQHADLTGDDAAASICHQPGNAFGNSYATPFVKRNLVVQNRTDYELIGSPNHSGATQTNRNYYDISYLLNASVWDTFFLSTIRSQGKPEHPALIPYGPGGAGINDPVGAAASLMVNGSFNVNSTDKQAWKAFLGSSKYFKHQTDTKVNAGAAFPRSLEQPTAAADQPTGTQDDSFSGFRRLTDPELDALATEIVKQVRLRGPFVSLSHFVNRALGDVSRQGAMTRCGALQMAIDEAGININYAGNKSGFRGVSASKDRLNLSEKNGAPRADLDGGDTGDRPSDANSSDPDWAMTSQDNNFGTVASIVADRVMLRTIKNEQGYRSTGIPGWLTQADVLQVIGPVITTRSDTFRIRAYGEALGADGKTVLANAWCEAIVQRVPDYVDLANKATDRPKDLNNINKTYGRRFQIVSFRWMSHDEI